MSDSILDSNKCVDYGGGLCYGGGLFSSAANYATLTNCRIGANIASYAGGGLAISRDAASVLPRGGVIAVGVIGVGGVVI